MEMSYREWEKRQQREREPGRRTASRRQSRKGGGLGSREKRRLTQLVICVVLFLAVFAGKGIIPEKTEQLRTKLLETIQMDTDFRAVFSEFGHAIAEGESITEAFGVLWTDVFAGGGTVMVSAVSDPDYSDFYRAEVAFLTGYPETVEPAEHWLRWTPQPEAQPETEPVPTPTPTPTPAPEPTPEVPAVEYVAYSGPALPDNATMDKYNLSVLGVGEVVVPTSGWVSSEFGWREHPVDGGQKFHNGVDLAVNTGTDVLAFADGTIDYIGESPIYGKYLQIVHAGGLTSFYAHCNELCVRQGQTVQAGEKVAESGETGNVTGPHLHFELKLNGVLLNPLYYIESD